MLREYLVGIQYPFAMHIQLSFFILSAAGCLCSQLGPLCSAWLATDQRTAWKQCSQAFSCSLLSFAGKWRRFPNLFLIVLWCSTPWSLWSYPANYYPSSWVLTRYMQLLSPALSSLLLCVEVRAQHYPRAGSYWSRHLFEACHKCWRPGSTNWWEFRFALGSVSRYFDRSFRFFCY